jgi:hypothetical protein
MADPFAWHSVLASTMKVMYGFEATKWFSMQLIAIHGVLPNLRLKLSGWGGHTCRKRPILIAAAPARSSSATR